MVLPPASAVSRNWLTRLLFGKEKPDVADFFLTLACRLMVVYPAVIVVSFSLCRVWAVLIIVCWLFSGHWKERFFLFRNNIFLFLLILYLFFAVSGIFYTAATFKEAIREWHGRQTLIIVPVIASLLYQRPERRAQMLAVFNFSVFVALVVYLLVFVQSDVTWWDFLCHQTCYLFKNYIGTGIVLVLWAGLWVCCPFSSREIPWIRSLLPSPVLESLSAASRLHPWDIVCAVVRRRLPWQSLVFSAIRWSVVLGITVYLYFINPSRTAQLALCLSLGVLLLTWNFRRGLFYFLLFAAVLFPSAYSLSPFFALKIDRGFQEARMFWDTLRSGEVESLETNPEYSRVRNGRLSLYYGLTQRVMEKPLFGYGMGGVEGFCLDSSAQQLPNPHNEYLCIGVQSGLAGIVLFLLWLGAVFCCSFNRPAPWRHLGLFIVTVLVVDSMFNCSLSYSSASRFYGILFAALFAADAVRRSRFSQPSFAVILAAAGKSRRFGDDSVKKPFVSLNGRPVWLHSAERFAARGDVRQLIVVVSPEDKQWFHDVYAVEIERLNIDVVCGGAERFESVQRGLDTVRESIDFVAVHDAARPGVSEEAIDAVFEAAKRHAAAMLAVPVVGTVKRVHDNRIIETVPRENLWEAQTPQVFERRLLLDAYAERYGTPTDDAQLVERLGKPVFIVSSDRRNIKITTPEDLELVPRFFRNEKTAF